MSRDRSLDIAVTGVHARLPGVTDLDDWWAATLAGRVLTTRLDRADLLAAGVPAALVDDPDYVPARGHLADADRFDHTLLRVSARDAELMDPQHRLMLETAWAALEDAGTAGPAAAEHTTGVYASGSGSGYLRAMLANGPLDPLTLDQALHGTEPDFVASLISYKLGLTGPALGVQTACSSSLVGVHLAVQALLAGECDQAVVVAAGIDFPQAGHLHVPGGIQSVSGNCRPFDAAADGVVAGSGVVAVVLRRLADALDDGPEPYGVLLGTAVNNDGAAKAGYYAPSVTGQEAVIRAALASADVGGESIGYLEAHATGTRVGDPIEWAAASAALTTAGARPGQVAVGALKAAIGHLDSASGLAGLVRALWVVREGVVPPVAGFTALNPLLEADGSPLYVPTEAAAWSGPQPRRAGVSSFGIGGTNAHVIVEQPPAAPAVPPRPERERLVVLSAADGAALTRTAARLAEHLHRAGPDLADVAYTLAAGRAALPERLAVTGRTAAEVADRLTGDAGALRGRAPVDGPAPVVYLLPGQGTQQPGMAAPLAGALPGFADHLDECLAAFDAELSARLRRALHDPDAPADELAATALAQPALFAVGYAAGRALTALGVAPAALVGHSLGELTAACLAGTFGLADAARFVAARGRAMQDCPPGAMLALGCDPDTARDLLAETGAELAVATVNSADGCTVAGAVEEVRRFADRLGDRVFHRVLRTSHAFHSALVEPALPALDRALDGVRAHPPAVPYASNLTGRLVQPGEPVDARSYVAQARRPVRFADALADTMARLPGCVAVEVGPGRVLTGLAEAAGLPAVPLCPLRTDRPEGEVLAALGTLWTWGQPVPAGLLGGADGRLAHLPGYAFGGRRWLAPEATPPAARAPADRAVADRAVSGRADTDPAVGERAGVDRPQRSGAGGPDPAVLVPKLWAEVLGHTDLADDSDFFALGGDSLLITQLARRVHEELGLRVPLREMLAGRTLGRQTAVVRDALRRDRARPES
ncbi:polyketide synthase subunit [Micromonospora rosaria]|uniref:Polyketide synthase subunit n=1 Tax=Micromonospora rosaria TaxID=47874 RepID=A0A136PXG0_9ACTN|nr:type I polyketide synthase [Micromonospora rosaria]KXK63105.1 polyketide synthase subunit [Micromonospora rosaria]